MALTRYSDDNIAYFVTSVTYERKSVFNDRFASELLLNIILYHKYSSHFHIYGFVIMPDHFHIIIQPYAEITLSTIIKRIKGNFTRFYNLYANYSEPIWQKSFYDHGIRHNQELIRIINYIHNNPVRKGMVTEQTRYEFSSSTFYECGDSRFALLIDRLE